MDPPKFLVVNISSTRSDEDGETVVACVLDPKDDPKNLIKRQSYVVYSECRDRNSGKHKAGIF